MRRFLLDTGSAADYVHRRLSVYDRARMAVGEGHRVCICSPVLAELWYGVEYSNTRQRNTERLRRSYRSLSSGRLPTMRPKSMDVSPPSCGEQAGQSVRWTC